MSASPAGELQPPPTWRRCGATAAATVWLPTLLPVLVGTLADCGHCATSYWRSLPVVPGLLAPAALGLDDAAFFVAGGAATLALLGLVAMARREAPPWLVVVAQVAVALCSGLTALGYAHALRL